MGIYSVKTAKLNFLLELKSGIKFTVYVNEKKGLTARVPFYIMKGIKKVNPFRYVEAL